MPKQPWIQAVILSGTVVVSLFVGSFITLNTIDDDPGKVPSPAATTAPVVATAQPSPTIERRW